MSNLTANKDILCLSALYLHIIHYHADKVLDYIHRPALTFSLQLITSLSLQMLHYYSYINTFSFSVSQEGERTGGKRKENEDTPFPNHN